MYTFYQLIIYNSILQFSRALFCLFSGEFRPGETWSIFCTFFGFARSREGEKKFLFFWLFFRWRLPLDYNLNSDRGASVSAMRFRWKLFNSQFSRGIKMLHNEKGQKGETTETSHHKLLHWTFFCCVTLFKFDSIQFWRFPPELELSSRALTLHKEHKAEKEKNNNWQLSSGSDEHFSCGNMCDESSTFLFSFPHSTRIQQQIFPVVEINQTFPLHLGIAATRQSSWWKLEKFRWWKNVNIFILFYFRLSFGFYSY